MESDVELHDRGLKLEESTSSKDKSETNIDESSQEQHQHHRHQIANEVTDTDELDDYHYEEEDDDEVDYDDDDNLEVVADESLGTTILREIQDGTYVCLVCTGEINKDSQIWTCNECFRVYDLDCIQDWAIRGSSTNKTSKEWRCPSCNHATKVIPRVFTCWCGQQTNPDHNVLMPFSCGNTCNYKYPDCIHNCLSICHPGKHPICGAMGPPMKCHCGKETKQLPCLITPYNKGWHCDQDCNSILCDIGHKCIKGCHSGYCQLCMIIIKISCYCSSELKEIACHEKKLMDCGDRIGGYSCGKMTRYYYQCKQHYELKSCQPPPSSLMICKYSPDVITTCYCGKTKVDLHNRTKCTDPIPECGNICGKLLPCGCRCKFKCHEGDCECISIHEIKCACGHESYLAPCKFIQSGIKPKCNHKCSVLLNCRKHYHRLECCPDEQIGLARERDRKKAIRNNIRSNFRQDVMSIEASHICTKTCNRLKPCGKHTCHALCHNGPCEVCLESTNEDLVCHCGKTVIPAPVRCGTKLVCHEQCTRVPLCGHRPEPHECHDDSINCPKCTALVVRKCDCGATLDIPGILCSQERVSCGKMCMVAKDCGHPCLRTCSSQCTKESIHNSSRNCQSYCKKIRNSCPHLCKLKCHFNKVGKSSNCDVVACTSEITVHCECGRLEKKIKCGASVDQPSNIGTVLECDSSCVAAKRDATLRAAFIGTPEPETAEEDNMPYSDLVLSVFVKQRAWCSKIEAQIRQLIADYNSQIENGINSPRKSHHFPPMTSPQRQFIHELGKAFQAYTESQDDEPKRSVFLVITNLTTIPAMKIEEAVDYKRELESEKKKVQQLTQEQIDESLYNAIIIQDLFFGLVKDDLDRELKPLYQDKMENYEIQWLKDSSFIFYSPEKFKNMDVEEENKLYLLLKSFRRVLREKSLAFDCKLCLIDDSATFVLKMDNSGTNNASQSESSSIQDVSETKKSQNGFDVLQTDD